MISKRSLLRHSIEHANPLNLVGVTKSALPFAYENKTIHTNFSLLGYFPYLSEVMHLAEDII